VPQVCQQYNGITCDVYPQIYRKEITG